LRHWYGTGDRKAVRDFKRESNLVRVKGSCGWARKRAKHTSSEVTNQKRGGEAGLADQKAGGTYGLKRSLGGAALTRFKGKGGLTQRPEG